MNCHPRRVNLLERQVCYTNKAAFVADVMNQRWQTRQILILESDADQAAQIAAGFQGDVVPTEVITIAQPDQALDFLCAQTADQHRGNDNTLGKPDLILLSFTPDASLMLLRAIKCDPLLRSIPVILLSQTEDMPVVFQSYLAQGNCYILKSSHHGDLTTIAQEIEAFWLGIVTLPLH